MIASSDPSLLRDATRTAEEFARQFMREDVAGIAFLGAIVRGYFDNAADIDAEESVPWDRGKRWAFSESRLFFDPDGRINRLLREKVPLRPEERRWLLIAGITLSEWYINRLTALWVQRGSIASAHSMFSPGLSCFFDVLFSLNNRLVADHKWRYYCAERLEDLPPGFGARMGEVMTLHALDEDDLARRRDAFMGMWRDTLPLVEQDVGMRWDEFKDTV